ncbi:cutinase family protein [Gordonia phthalatica]|uniref:Cutinase n=1 Tax=Gordonia phthalatica TaxID=1136941 RepID=A0A0N9ND05_9ACTN|nr:cutinase family protein [Gordonia phthalatica]ALG83376.1 cutinase [Gordonia phthalatica]
MLKFRRLRRLLLVVLALAVVAVILIGFLLYQLFKPAPVPPHPGPGPTTSAPPGHADAQPADCPDVLTLVIPGTWESKANDDPLNPTANPKSLMLRVSSQLQQKYPESRTEVYTVPYKAQFRNPTNLADRQADYNDSRRQGTTRAKNKIAKTYKHCPLTHYVLMGFSQGAVIAGDIASDIGNDRGPIPAADQDLILGVGLIADGRRQPGGQQDVAPSPKGVGTEVALGGFGSLVPGITMTGGRSGGFGDLTDRVYSICAPGDLICDAPTVTDPLQAISKLANAANNPVHAMYATKKYWKSKDGGQTATQWMFAWSSRLISSAPKPKHT